MATPTLSREQLVEAALQLEGGEFDSLINDLQHQRFLHTTLKLPFSEHELLDVVAERIPSSQAARYAQLSHEAKERPLNEAEERELAGLVDLHENLGARQYGAIEEIARVRGQSVAQVKRQLGWGVQDPLPVP